MNEPELTPETCPHCAGPRVLAGAGPGYVDWACTECLRVGREVSCAE